MLDEIEADLQRCEAILAGSGPSGDGLPSARRSGRGTPAAPSLAPWQQQQQQAGNSTPPPSKRAQEHQQQQPGGKGKPKSMADLLAMLEEAPAGPVEIDPALLYSPESSVELRGSPSSSTLGGYGTPSGRSASKDRAQQQLSQEFSLRAYRHSPGGLGEGPEGMGGGSGLQRMGSGDSLDWGGLKQQVGAGAGGSLRLLSPADSKVLHHRSVAQRPLSAPQRAAPARPPAAAGAPLSSSGPSKASGGRVGRGGGVEAGRADAATQHRQQLQLQLEDVFTSGVRGSTAGLLAMGREVRLQRLAQPRKELWESCAQRKLEDEQLELKECTFAPKVGRPPESHRQRAGMPVDERLYRQMEGKWEMLKRAKEEQESSRLAECTFAPQLNQPERHLRLEYTPIHKRVGEEQRKRSVKLAQMRVLEDLTNPHNTFAPQLNPRSLQLAAEREERELYAASPASSVRRSRSFVGGLLDDEVCTFSPSINPASERLLESSATVPADFQERLRYYSQRRDAKQRQMEAEQGSDACTFRPDTGNAVEVLAFSDRAGHLLESEAERVERMAREEAARLEARRAAKEQEIYGGMDFRPQLNPRSLRMAKAKPVEELASAEKVAQKVAQLRAAEEERLRQECTFQPDTAKPRVRGGHGEEYKEPQPKARLTIAGQGFDGILDRINDYQAEREAKAARIKEEAQRRELRECSFTPGINRQPPPKPKGPVVVRGLGRYLELKQLAERQKKEAEERAAQVFNLNPKGPAAGRTVPQPFKLSGLARLEQRAQVKQGEALQSALREKMQECTFQPQTNHVKRKQALASILGQQEAAFALD